MSTNGERRTGMNEGQIELAVTEWITKPHWWGRWRVRFDVEAYRLTGTGNAEWLGTLAWGFKTADEAHAFAERYLAENGEQE